MKNSQIKDEYIKVITDKMPYRDDSPIKKSLKKDMKKLRTDTLFHINECIKKAGRSK